MVKKIKANANDCAAFVYDGTVFTWGSFGNFEVQDNVHGPMKKVPAYEAQQFKLQVVQDSDGKIFAVQPKLLE